FVAVPLVIGLMNFVVPLQLGVRDVAFPVLNSVSFWLTASGALLINASLVIGNFARTGWMGYPPLSELAFSPDVGVDYYLWSLQISGIGTLLSGVNFVTTILKLRAPGMTYFRMPVFCYRSIVLATLGISVLSFMVWLHHFFTIGARADVNAFFGIMSSIIAVPTGVKVFNWLFTMFRGRVVYRTPMLFAIGFLVTFVIGGMTGVLLAVPPVDFVLHNSAFLVAHFHNVIIGGVVFGAFAGYNYWFPKVFGFTLDERWGKAGFWCWLVGFYLAFMPLYVLGLHGMTRRLQHISDPSWQPWLLVAEARATVIMCGI